MSTVLVAYATRRGSTKEIAEWIGDALRTAGHTVDVRPAGDVRDVAGYDAVVLGSALYVQRWCRDARRFARRHRRVLARRPVWLFSSGPLDHTADSGDLPPVRGVRRLSERFGAEAVTFGGALQAGTQGWTARNIAKDHGGDFRDRVQIRQWAEKIAADLAVNAAH